MNAPRSALVVTKVFWPEMTVGVHRTAALCQYLVDMGWHVTVIAARPAPGATLDPDLLSANQDRLKVVRTWCPDLPLIAARVLKGPVRSRKNKAAQQGPGHTAERAPDRNGRRSKPSGVRTMIDWLSLWLHIPDGCTGWFAPAVWAGLRQARRRYPNVIYSSGPRWTGHLVAAALSRALCRPLVTDFRDPWCGSAFRKVRYAAQQHLNAALERSVVRQSTKMTCAWDGIRRLLVGRYPSREGDVSTILNGFDPASIDSVAPIRLSEDRCVLLHAGSFYGPRSPIPLLVGLQRLNRRRPDVAEKLLVVFLGGTSYNGRPLTEIVQSHGVAGSVRVMLPVRHSEAMAYLKGADAAILFGQSGKESLASVPAKVYDYIGAGKTVLAIGTGDEACTIMERGGCQVWRRSVEDRNGIMQAVCEIVDTNGRRSDTGCDTARSQFIRRAMAARLEQTLLGAIGVDRAGRELGSPCGLPSGKSTESIGEDRPVCH